ncbi:hypothetical protein ACFP51_14115 [Streptomyces pratens]|uniref:Uncharacterized protein n=1 Tax=Streptomyces pratens TaxID=887456 RepID=A0ABW1M747_9ACTN
MTRHTSATTAMAVTTGRKIADRTNHRLRVCPSSSSASARPSTIDPAVVVTARTRVCHTAVPKSELPAISV